MEQDVENGYQAVCSTCLSSDRNLFSLNGMPSMSQIFRLLMYDFPGERYGDVLQEFEHFICWECVAHMKRVSRFKRQVHSAQEHLRVLALSRNQESVDHTYMSQSLSSLEMTTKADYDKIYFDYTAGEEQEEWQFLSITTAEAVKSEQYDVAQAVRDNINLDIDDHMLEVPQIVLDNPGHVMSQMVVNTAEIVSSSDIFTHVKGELAAEDESSRSNISLLVTTREKKPRPAQEAVNKAMYTTEYMTEDDMHTSRELAKLKVQYASSVYKCELCIIGFYTQQQVEDHFVNSHSAKEGLTPCKVCYIYVGEATLQQHIDEHYYRYTCKLCKHVEYSAKMISLHVRGHDVRKDNSVIKFGDPQPNSKYTCKLCKHVEYSAKMISLHVRGHDVRKDNSVIKFGDPQPNSKKSIPVRRKKDVDPANPKPGDLRKLLSKTTIEGYQCLECDMFFKNSRARKNHVARFHREGLQCDHCKKRFVNRTTLATHLKLHEGPPPRKECPICHKMVRVMQLKYHIQRHQNKEHHECVECNKVFSHAATYQAHLKYSRAHAPDHVFKNPDLPPPGPKAGYALARVHAPDHVFKFPCPMCNKGYPTKEQMQDHFNYQHLGKTTHKCPVCDKPIASRANVEKHMMRVHGEKKEKPRNHQCQLCGKAFTDKKALTQHAVIHSGDRPLSCDICHQTFKQKASLYTHRKRVHKVYPPKRLVEFVDTKPQTVST